MKTATKLIESVLSGASVQKVVEAEMDNPFKGSGAGARQREAMLRWAEIKDEASRLRAQMNDLDQEAKEIAEELGMVEIIERMDEQIAYLDEIQKKITLTTKPNPKYAQLWKDLRERILNELGEQAAAITALMDEMLDAHLKSTMSTAPVLRKFSKADVKKRGVGEASIGSMLKGVWNKLKKAIQGLFKRSDQIDTDLEKLDQAVSGQAESRRPRRRQIREADAFGLIPDAGDDPMVTVNDSNSYVFQFTDGFMANAYYDLVRSRLAGLVVDWPMISGLAGQREWTVRISGKISDREFGLLKDWASSYDGELTSQGLSWET